MKKTAKYNFEKVNKFLGYGDHKSANVWFLGIEEAVNIMNPENIDRIYNSRYETFYGCRHTRTPVYQIISKIILGLKRSNWINEWQDYRNNILFSPGSEAVQLNLFPLGKHNIKDWPQKYEDWFGLNYDEYYNEIITNKNGRLTLIKKELEEYSKLTIIFGSLKYRTDLIKFFGLEKEESIVNDDYIFYVKSKILFTPFFGYRGKTGMSNEKIQQLINMINNYKLNPFLK